MPEPQLHPAIDLGRFAPSLGDTCSEYLADHRASLEAAIRRGEGGLQAASRHARALDGLLGALHCAATAAARDVGHAPRGRVALVAVGGYGRGELGLHSDVDVLFLCDDPEDPHAQAVAEGVLYPLWDLGVRIGHAVRGVQETLALSREDVRTATTLLDLRLVAGDRGIVDELHEGTSRGVLASGLGDLLDSLEEDLAGRHARFGGSLFLLEPEVKLGRGGLRDVDVALWAGKARFRAPSWRELVRVGALLPRELAAIADARELLWRVRNMLHLRAGRQQDRLTFADQEEIAVALGFEDSLRDGLAVERFMQSYYRSAREVARSAERMLERARPRPRRAPGRARKLPGGLATFDGKITVADVDAVVREPVVALRVFQAVAREGEPPDPFVVDAIGRAAADPDWRATLRDDPEAVRIFLKLLTHVADVPLPQGSLVAELHELGIVSAFIPEFEAITGRVQHDVYHVYTVDVHSVLTVDLLRALVRGDRTADLPTASRVAAETGRRMPLFLAALVHDVGKAQGHGHAERGAELARDIAARLELPPVDVEHVAWLVRNHLRLYHWATRRDVSDPEVAAEIAAAVGTVERLDDLFLLTVADLSTTNPGAMNAWKARMLDELLANVTLTLERSAPTDEARRASELRRTLFERLAGGDEEAPVRSFLATMPDRYLLATPLSAVRTHARELARRPAEGVRVFRGEGPSEDLDELVVCAPDRPGLLADVTVVLAANRLAVQAAQIYTRRTAPDPDGGDEAFDLFHVRPAGSGEGPVPARTAARVERDLAALLAGEVDRSALLERLPSPPAWARRHVPEVATEVHVDNGASSRFTIVDVFTRDRLGLLHVLAEAIHGEGLSIALSRVNTEGHRAADVFYVTEPGGGKVADPARLARLSVVIRDALAAFHARSEA